MKKNLTLITDEIRDRVSAYEAGKALGLRPDGHGRCACPAHSGTDRNCKLFKDDRGFYCFVCKTGGDVIRLVERVNECSFPDAVEWLNSAFKLGLKLDGKETRQDRRDAQIAGKRRQIERELKDAIADELYETYLDAGELVISLERDKEDYRPVRWDEEWDSRFVAALKLLPEARELVAETALEAIGNRQ